MADGWIHTRHRDSSWINEVEGTGQVLSRHELREQAVSFGRRFALKHGVDHVVHDRDGAVCAHRDAGSLT